jgi:hypothetical protein
MSGHHNLTIYTGKDADICRECRYGEFVKSAHLFDNESYICWNKKGSPTAPDSLRPDDGCRGFAMASKAIRLLYKGV